MVFAGGEGGEGGLEGGGADDGDEDDIGGRRSCGELGAGRRAPPMSLRAGEERRRGLARAAAKRSAGS